MNYFNYLLVFSTCLLTGSSSFAALTLVVNSTNETFSLIGSDTGDFRYARTDTANTDGSVLWMSDPGTGVFTFANLLPTANLIGGTLDGASFSYDDFLFTAFVFNFSSPDLVAGEHVIQGMGNLVSYSDWHSDTKSALLDLVRNVGFVAPLDNPTFDNITLTESTVPEPGFYGMLAVLCALTFSVVSRRRADC